MTTAEWLRDIYKEHYQKYKAKARARLTLIGFLLMVIGILAFGITSQAINYTQLEKKAEALQDTVAAKEQELSQKSMTPEPQTFVDAEALGEYTITYYCPCEECSAHWGTQTSTGVSAQEGVTIAVDPEVIPYGSLIYIEGIGYRVAQDCGGAIKGNRIDVYMDSHQKTVENGIHEANIYLITGGIENDKK